MNGTFAIFCLLGFLGAFLGAKTRMAAGTLLGGILFTALGFLAGLDVISAPDFYTAALQVLAGCLVGVSITRAALAGIRGLFAPVVGNVLILMGASACIAWLDVHVFGWDARTAWLAAAPARMQDMIIFATTTNADAKAVAASQIVRLVAVIALTPLFVRFFLRNSAGAPGRSGAEHAASHAVQAGHAKELPDPAALPRMRAVVTVRVLLLGTCGGVLGWLSGVPCGILLGAMLAVGAGNLLGFSANYMPLKMLFLLQAMAGILLGLQLTPDSLGALWAALPVVAVNTITLMAASVFSAHVLWRVFHWDAATAWLAAAPARVQDMIILGTTLNAAGENIVAVHLLRILVVTVVTPVLLIYL